MKIEVGKAYFMRNYPDNYDYVLIIRKEFDNLYKEDIYIGEILLNGKCVPDCCNEGGEYTWSARGSWDCGDFHGLGEDSNDLVEEKPLTCMPKGKGYPMGKKKDEDNT